MCRVCGCIGDFLTPSDARSTSHLNTNTRGKHNDRSDKGSTAHSPTELDNAAADGAGDGSVAVATHVHVPIAATLANVRVSGCVCKMRCRSITYTIGVWCA